MWIKAKLKSLTAEQIDVLKVVREEWLKIGLATRTDWPAVRRIVPALYSGLNFRPPDSIVSFDSPRAGLLAAATTAAEVRSKPLRLREVVRRRVRRQVSRALRYNVRDQVRTSIQEEIRQQVRRELRDQVETRLVGELPQLFLTLGDVAFGLHESPWLAAYDFFSRIGIKGLPPARPWVELARAGAGWWWSFGSVAIVTSAPTVLRRDPEHRLHCEDGPALAYPDGWTIWAIHGVSVPQRVVTRARSLSVDEIVYEPDLDVRRAMLERFGYERFVRKAGLKPVQTDGFGRLYRLDPRWNEPIALVEVQNSTPEPNGSHRQYFLCVPPTVRTAHEAVAWTFRLGPREYRPDVES